MPSPIQENVGYDQHGTVEAVRNIRRLPDGTYHLRIRNRNQRYAEDFTTLQEAIRRRNEIRESSGTRHPIAPL